VHYRLIIGDLARAQLQNLPPETRRNLGYRLHLLQTNLIGDVIKLHGGSEAKYRLRVGSFRALFTLTDDLIFVYAVKDRKEAYD
jgi:mRNA-degrading endonuclease RelE of RelBE toxin-antitoxin system